jgi:hypothetical protein
MAITGTYGFVYCGVNGLGVGLFVVQNERFIGSDYMGAKYEGTATENSDDSITLDISFEVPAGIILVQGTSPQDLPHRRRIVHTFPPGFGDGVPQDISSPPGTVTVMIKRVEDSFADQAINGFRLIRRD